jgi:hypothetical protein
MKIERLIRPFAVSLAAKADLLSDQAGLCSKQQTRVRESMGQDIRKLCDIIFPAERLPDVSKAAQDLAQPRDLRRETWQSQPQFDPGRRLFLLEHWMPVGMMCEACVSLGVDEIISYLDETLKIVWITRDEDRQLTRLKYRTRRPDPANAYAKAGITLVPAELA